MQMGVRMNSARIGRFLSVDPLHELMPSHNPYHYAFNSPLVWKDPSGLAPEKDKNIHSEKMLTWVIKFESSITDEVIVTAARYENESASYVYFDVPVHATAEFDAGTVNNVSTSGFYYGGVGSSRSSGKWGGNPKSNHHLTKDGYGNKGVWKVTKKWDASYIKQYEKFAGRQAEIYKNNGDRFACEDLALQVLIDFASQNGLPVILQNDVGVFNASDTKWNTYSSPLKAFRDQLLSSTNSNHILKFNNTNVIEVNDLVSGDMLVQVNEKGRGHHTQLVRDANSFWIEIIQGSLKTSWGRLTSNPGSIFGYKGTLLNTSYYNKKGGTYFSGYSHTFENFNKLKQFKSRRWNFYQFNGVK